MKNRGGVFDWFINPSCLPIMLLKKRHVLTTPSIPHILKEKR
tara:strand:+ start:835 stop:960 length:126 start_codon:yes stop_codon:yes gene_type:complete